MIGAVLAVASMSALMSTPTVDQSAKRGEFASKQMQLFFDRLDIDYDAAAALIQRDVFILKSEESKPGDGFFVEKKKFVTRLGTCKFLEFEDVPPSPVPDTISAWMHWSCPSSLRPNNIVGNNYDVRFGVIASDSGKGVVIVMYQERPAVKNG